MPIPLTCSLSCNTLSSSCYVAAPSQGELLSDESSPDLKTAAALEALAAADHSLVLGADETLQLLAVAGRVHKAYAA